MNCEESIKWLDSLIKTLGQSQYQSLWNWEQPLTEIKEMLESKIVVELPCKVGETLCVIDDRFEGLPQDVIKRLGKGNHSYKIECYEKITYGTLLRLLIEKNKNLEQGYLMLFFTSKSEAEQKLKELNANG